MSIKISFMHYRNYITRTTVKLPVVFEEFDMVYFFFDNFIFSLSMSIGKSSTLAKTTCGCSPPHPGFLRACSFSSLKLFRKVHAYHAFLINDDKTLSLLLNLYIQF